MKSRIISLILSLLLFVVAVALASGCGDAADLEPTAAAAMAPPCDESSGGPKAYAGGYACDASGWPDAQLAELLCFAEDRSQLTGCTVRVKNTDDTPTYRVQCVARCPQGAALMSPDELDYLRRAHPELGL